jgi:NAD(P)-dependent dehydrogenase (short-subunit alcohol dehydrogenase family)
LSTPVAIVTGAGSGLGRATALALSATDLAVVAVGRREDRLRETALAAQGEVRVVAADVARAEGRARIVSSVAAGEHVRFLVHCAGVHAIEPFALIDEGAWREVLSINVDARLFLTQALLPHLIAGSRILFVGSNSATRARRSATAYCVSQAASFMLHECLKIELADRGIGVTSALPSPVATPMLAAQLAADPAIYPDAEDYRKLHAAGRLIAPATVARFYRWLLTQVPAEAYSARAWNVRDETYHRQWLAGDDLYAGARQASPP